MNSAPESKRKMSKIILEIAAAFIGVGKTAEEKQNRLLAACSAWNMACGSPEIRRQQLEQYVKGYQRYNPAISPSDLVKIRTDMESLIGRKLRLFPEDRRQIVSAKVVMIGKNYRIEVASATTQSGLGKGQPLETEHDSRRRQTADPGPGQAETPQGPEGLSGGQ
jgi:hypothetical protein